MPDERGAGTVAPVADDSTYCPVQIAAKGLKGEAGPPRRSSKWVRAQRGALCVDDKWMTQGNWRIKHDDVKRATLYSTRQFFFVRVFVLAVETASDAYQFGIRSDPFGGRELPFTVERIETRLGHTVYSVCVRLAVIALVTALVLIGVT